MLHFFLPDFVYDLRRFQIPAKRAFDGTIIFELMLGPLGKTIEVESIPTDSCAGAYCVTFDDLHMANSTKIIFIILLVNFHNDILA